MQSAPQTAYPRLTADTAAEVAVVGGGIAGICTAWELARLGTRVVLIDAGRVAAASTGGTTAKVTALHGAIYHRLTSDQAALYAQSQTAAIHDLHRAAQTLRAGCDWEPRDAYTYAVDRIHADTITAEAQAASAAGLHASLVSSTSLPYPVPLAVRVRDQAQFHPRRLLLAMADDILANGGQIFEHTRAIAVAGGHVRTEAGAEITTADTVITTGFPIIDRPEIMLRLSPHRELVVAAPIAASADPHGMYLGLDDDRSVRTAPLGHDQRLLIVTGEVYSPNDASVADRFRKLSDWTHERFPGTRIAYRWSAQDYTTSDRIPFVGPLPHAERTWVATGFGAWGMTNAMMSATLLSALIHGKTPPAWSEMYDPRRLHPLQEAPQLVRNATTTVTNLAGKYLTHPRLTPADVPPGTGAIISVDGHRCAAYREPGGELHTVSATCTHRGCTVRFNDNDATWECPCHGSRFGPDGTVLQGPALTPLPPIDTPSS